MNLVITCHYPILFPRPISSNLGEMRTSSPEKHFKYLPSLKRRVELCPSGSGAFTVPHALIYNWKQVLWVTFTTVCPLCFCYQSLWAWSALRPRQTFPNESGYLQLQPVSISALSKRSGLSVHAGAPKERIRRRARSWCYCCDLLWMVNLNDKSPLVHRWQEETETTVCLWKLHRNTTKIKSQKTQTGCFKLTWVLNEMSSLTECQVSDAWVSGTPCGNISKGYHRATIGD